MSTEPTVPPRPPFPTRVTTTWDNDVNTWVADTNAAIASENAHQQWVREQTPAAIGALGLSCASEVSITGAISLDATAFGRMHVCGGTAADYTVTLPPVAGNAGKLLGVRIAGSCTKLVTLDGAGSETIDGAATRVMWAGESAILLCDGSRWMKIAGKTVPMGTYINPSASQSVETGAITNVLAQTAVYDYGGLSDGLYRIIIKRAGLYSIHGRVNFQDNIAFSYSVLKNSGNICTMAIVANSGYGPVLTCDCILSSGDTLYMSVYQTSGVARSLSISGNTISGLSAKEVPTW